MANNDVLFKDQSTSPASFSPESTDQGTNAAGQTIKRPMYGMADGANVSFGNKSDAAWNGTDAAPSAISIFKRIANFVSGTLTTVNAAGTAIIGKVGIDQSTPGVSNGFALVPPSVTGSVTGPSVGVTSGLLLAAATRRFLAITNQSTAATVTIAFGTTAVIGGAGCYDIGPGVTRTWSYAVPADAINAIASATAPLTIQVN